MWQNIMTRINLGGKAVLMFWFVLFYISLIMVYWRKPRQELKLGGNLEAEADAAEEEPCLLAGLLLMAYLVWFCKEPRIVPTHNWMGPSLSISN